MFFHRNDRAVWLKRDNKKRGKKRKNIKSEKERGIKSGKII
jgi:hypothetical protein